MFRRRNLNYVASILMCYLMNECIHFSNAFIAHLPNFTSSFTEAIQLNILSASASEPEDKDQSAGIGTWNPFRLAVLKLGLTEPKYLSPLNYEKRQGTYACANCGSNLFDSKGKYDSGSGWPSYWRTFSENRIKYRKEWDGRVEVSCRKCESHLGHVFLDGPMRCEVAVEDLKGIPIDDLKTSDPNNMYTRLPRYCINGAALKFQEYDIKKI